MANRSDDGLPCCGYENPEVVMWNDFNRVVQCHNCGAAWAPKEGHA